MSRSPGSYCGSLGPTPRALSGLLAPGAEQARTQSQRRNVGNGFRSYYTSGKINGNSASLHCERVLAHMSRITPAVLKVVVRPELFEQFTPAAIRQLERISPETPHFDILGRLEDLADSASRKGIVVPMIRSLRDIDVAFRPPPPPARKPARGPRVRFPEPPTYR